MPLFRVQASFVVPWDVLRQYSASPGLSFSLQTSCAYYYYYAGDNFYCHYHHYYYYHYCVSTKENGILFLRLLAGSGLMPSCVKQFRLTDSLCKNASTSCDRGGIVINAWVLIRSSKFFDVAREVKVSAVFVVRFDLCKRYNIVGFAPVFAVRFGCVNFLDRVEVAVSFALRFDCVVFSEIWLWKFFIRWLYKFGNVRLWYLSLWNCFETEGKNKKQNRV